MRRPLFIWRQRDRCAGPSPAPHLDLAPAPYGWFPRYLPHSSAAPDCFDRRLSMSARLASLSNRIAPHAFVAPVFSCRPGLRWRHRKTLTIRTARPSSVAPAARADPRGLGEPAAGASPSPDAASEMAECSDPHEITSHRHCRGSNRNQLDPEL